MTVLFTPLGLAYGALYSAVLLVRPHKVVVVTSREAVGNLYAALDAARFYHSSFEVESHTLDDALAGFEEGRLLAKFLVQAGAGHEGTNVVNLSGGTLVLQDCARSTADALRRAGKPVREIAVVDRRTPEEQRRVPFVVGEMVEVPPL